MPVIKGSQTQAAGAGATVAPKVFSMRDIETQARALIYQARERAEALIAAAQREAETLRTTGQAEGFAEGKQEGIAKGMEEGRELGRQQALAEHKAAIEQMLNAMNTALSDIDQQRRSLAADATTEVIQLAIAIAERVTKRLGVLDPSVAKANVAEAMQLVVHARDVRIAVHPSQRQTLEETLPAMRMQWPNLEHIELIDDSELTPGGCRVYTKNGLVDGDLQQQLDRIVMELLPATPTA